MKMLMSQGRGNAIDVSVLLMGMLLRCGNVWAATYTVGDAAGWSFNVVGWPNGKTFRAGDVLGKYESLLFFYHNFFLILQVKALIVFTSNSVYNTLSYRLTILH